jgi:hypothetical protein
MANNNLKIISWNCQSVKPKINELSAFLHQHKIDVVLLNETWLQPHIKFSISGFECYRTDRISSTTSSPHGGVAILINKSIKHQIINLRKTIAIEKIFIEIPTDGNKIKIGSIYCPPSIQAAVFKKDLYSLLCCQGPIILAGGFNAKHQFWNNPRNDRKGKILYDSCNHFSFKIVTPNNPTLIPCRGNPSTVDFPISKNITCSNPIVMNDLSSDHMPILFYANTLISRDLQTIPDYRKTDWPKLRKVITTEISKFSLPFTSSSTADSIDYKINYLNDIIKS